jgi:hypothetical protein
VTLALHTFDPDPRTAALCLDLSRIDPTVDDVVTDVVSQLDSYDPGLLETWRVEGLLLKAGVYTVHYLLPLKELLLLQGTKPVSPILAAQLLSCVAWRTFDNCVDGHEHYRVGPRKSLAACLHLVEFIQSRFGRSLTRELLAHYCTMTEQAVQEAHASIALDDIWRRCSILLLVPEHLAGLEEASLNLYRSYLCYCGLAHDMNDIVSDLTCGTQSLPLEWLRDSYDGALSVETFEAMEMKARVAVRPLEEEFARRAVSARLPMTNHLLSWAGRVFHRVT